MITMLCKLQDWFHDHCNGDWEHGEGIRIATMDNPGWAVDIALQGTGLECRPAPEVRIERSEQDWLHCFGHDGKFAIRCGAKNLEEGIASFLKWAV
jgi:hypothetical protein